jgi:hypothetical protein
MFLLPVPDILLINEDPLAQWKALSPKAIPPAPSAEILINSLLLLMLLNLALLTLNLITENEYQVFNLFKFIDNIFPAKINIQIDDIYHIADLL